MKLSIILYGLGFVLLFSSCSSLRSSEGLSEGEVNLNFIAPFAGSLRYGLVDNLEARYTRVGDHHFYDIFIHTHTDSSPYNYGLMLGTTTFNDYKRSFDYSGFTVSRKLSSVFTPYVGLVTTFNFRGKDERDYPNYLAVGSDIKIPLKSDRTINILLTPELSFTYPSADIGEAGYWSVFGSLNIGLIIDVYSAFGL